VSTAANGIQIRPFRFAFNSKPVVSGAEWTRRARRLEDMGYDVLAMADHFAAQSRQSAMAEDPHDPRNHTLAPFPALGFAAAATSKLRLSTLVLCNDFRNPAVVAKDATTLDVLSDGRFELGIGAGYLEDDYANLGVPFETPGRRVERLEQAVVIIKQLMEFDEVRDDAVAGESAYRVATINGPLAKQRPRCPIVIGGRNPRVLGIAGRHADIVSLQGRGNHTHKERIEIVLSAAGERGPTLEYGMVCRPADACDQELLGGSVDDIADHLRRHRDATGISYLMFTDVDGEADDFAPIVEALAGR
jgi:alkanesulfonate monooxygenase SsuD/methylene tetrahydromethanopterin reductase-like flavin-dependent oxidoreductase (luciferase family)